MADSMYIQPLKPVDLTEMYITFMDAFSDYPIAFKLTKEQFVRKFVQKLKIDFRLSAGAHHYDGSLVGFIFTAINYYEGKLTAYNGGTGVRPKHRGNQLTAKMYEYLVPLFKERKVGQCVLEVLVNNERAIKAYERIGFKKTKYFKCYVLSNLNQAEAKLPEYWSIVTVKQPNWSLYEKFYDFPPSFLDSQKMVAQNLANEIIIEVRDNEECAGFAIYQPLFGRISQLGVDKKRRGNGIGRALIAHIFETSELKKLTIININDKATDTKHFFKRVGFDNQIDQYEMILTL